MWIRVVPSSLAKGVREVQFTHKSSRAELLKKCYCAVERIVSARKQVLRNSIGYGKAGGDAT